MGALHRLVDLLQKLEALAAKVADYVLRRRYGIPLSDVQTLGEHYRAGIPAPWAVEGTR